MSFVSLGLFALGVLLLGGSIMAYGLYRNPVRFANLTALLQSSESSLLWNGTEEDVRQKKFVVDVIDNKHHIHFRVRTLAHGALYVYAQSALRKNAEANFFREDAATLLALLTKRISSLQGMEELLPSRGVIGFISATKPM